MVDIDWMLQYRQDYRPSHADIAGAGSERRWWANLQEEMEPLRRWWTCMQEGSSRNGKPIAYPTNMAQLLESTGFDNPIHRTIRIYLEPPNSAASDGQESGDTVEDNISKDCRAAMFARCEISGRAFDLVIHPEMSSIYAALLIFDCMEYRKASACTC